MTGFKELPLLGILRGVDKADAEPLAGVMAASGLRAVEATMNTEGACGLIETLTKFSQGNFAVGAGTVMDLEQAKKAFNAGARFMVSPVLIPEVVEFCHENSLCVFPGAFSPQEIYKAWSFKPSMVKVFPAKFFGPDYIKEIKGPLDNIKLLACGGVTPGNIAEFFIKGADAVAFGASIFKKEWLKAKKFSLIEKEIKKLINAFQNR
ncbi:MAG: bifunctional 4-hydroxy-2-oxoglutarate aldolase/2-dehydro-3-deoxy-phosphogluconate aldolase [Candidatus Omnitrophica bacterium]|nr:bifunctional 4-hydroxy-2-oxoglutarate aldolase/2-dehydro-3-deoxy-phosphogluconate aldolase [Candidatus Omnitrophota bacterium]MDD5429640.1 bifunctional 4-hydroxy-2-oxoglutarate aldolase/2-dehydro-3-deoxy-phosphogluconate aldolase [Candidatus Omnitrophota bacterium]